MKNRIRRGMDPILLAQHSLNMRDKSVLQFSVQSASDSMSRTKIRLPEMAGADQVALSATVYVFSGSNSPMSARATISFALSFSTNSIFPASKMAALLP